MVVRISTSDNSTSVRGSGSVPSVLLTVKDVAARLRLSESMIYRLVDAEQIGCHRVGTGRGRLRFSEADVQVYLEGCRQDVKTTLNGAQVKRQALKHLKL